MQPSVTTNLMEATRNEPVDEGTRSAAVASPSLRSLVVRGSAWTVAREVVMRGVRLGSNVVLTRLLTPEIFGLMNLVNVIGQGLQTFSDVGIGPSIIQNKRGDDPSFTNTAWTIQVVRGLALFLASCLLAWPFAILYEERALAWLLPITGITAVIAGFASTSLATLNRHLALGKRTVLEINSYLVSVVVMIVWALISPTIWSLVAGVMAGAAFRTIRSHWLVPGVKTRFHWDKAAAKELFRFGRWIFASTLLNFLAVRGDRFVVGKLMPMAEFGQYAIALVLATLVHDFLGHISQNVLFPTYVKLAGGKEKALRQRVLRVRLTILSFAIPLTCAMVLLGPWIVDVLYDDRYAQAGWMLQILAVAGIFRAMTSGTTPILLAKGDSFRQMVVTAGRLISLIACMSIGGWFWGMKGLIVGVAVTDLVNYPVIAWAVRRYGVWLPIVDAAALTAAAGMIGGGLWIQRML